MVLPISEELKQHIINGGFLDCKDFHDHSCVWEALTRFAIVFKSSYKYYIPIHFIPLIIFKRGRLLREPGKTLSHTLLNYLKSVCFMSLYVCILKYSLCTTKNVRHVVDGNFFVFVQNNDFSYFCNFLKNKNRMECIDFSIFQCFFGSLGT